MTTAAATGHVLRLYWAQERGNFQFLAFNAAVLPAALAYMGTRMVPDDPDQMRWWFAGSLTLGLGMTGISQVGFAVLFDRFQGRLDLVRSAPVPKLAYLLAHLALAVGESVVLVLAALPLLALLGAASISTAGVAAALAASVCAGAATGGVGAWIAFRAPDFDSANTWIAIAAIGFATMSPVFYEIEALPLILQPVAWLSPFTHVAELMRAVIAGVPPPWTALAATFAIAVGLNAASFRRIRWQE